jgi:outer membrane biosynthesis protein TonB
MSRQFSRTLKVVIIVHAVLLLLVFSRSGIARLFEPEPELIIPVEFVVDVSPAMPDINDVIPDVTEFEPEPILEPIPDPEPEAIPEPQAVLEPKPEPKPKPPKRKKIKISKTRVNSSNASKQKRLSAAEIKKLLDKGARAGDHTSIPDEDARCMDIIKRTLDSVWDQPSSEAAGDSIAVLQLKFSGNSRISSGKLYRKSGNVALDSSVSRITQNIQHINGLTPDFIRRHPSVTISFSVD